MSLLMLGFRCHDALKVNNTNILAFVGTYLWQLYVASFIWLRSRKSVVWRLVYGVSAWSFFIDTRLLSMLVFMVTTSGVNLARSQPAFGTDMRNCHELPHMKITKQSKTVAILFCHVRGKFLVARFVDMAVRFVYKLNEGSLPRCRRTCIVPCCA
jgi:hypothetical protein